MRARSYQGYMSPKIEEQLRTGQYEVGTEEVSAAASQVQKVYDSDPTTEKDVEAVLKLVQDTKPKSGKSANNAQAAATLLWQA
jgi:uridylate kinase